MPDDRTDGQGSRAPGKEVDLEEVLRLDREVAQLRAELAWHEQMNGTRAEQEAHDAEADAVDAAAAALTPEQLRAEMVAIGLDPDRVEREAEVSARLVVRWMQARDERDAARTEADAFAVYRSLVTTALGIDPGSCADDVKEAVEALREQRDEAHKMLDEIRAALGNGADEALWPPGKTLGEAVKWLAEAEERAERAEAERDATRAEAEELRLTLAVEQGRAQELPFSSPPRLRAAVNAERIRRGLSWREVAAQIGVSSSGFTRWNAGHDLSVSAYLKVCDWLRAAMIAADKETA